jgi:pyridinium-3,5-bisthiocarboxylic acid mononucleotide nickel chelatase
MGVLYFDCSAGAAGDMILSSLLDLDLDLEQLKAVLTLLPLKGYAIETVNTKKNGFRALQVMITVTEKQPPRHLPEITSMIRSSKLSAVVQEKSLAVFQTLARAEAKVHGISEDRVHFHEIGAVDSILDIVGSAAALEMLDIHTIYASPLPLGSGWAKTSHGRIPLPAPATMEIIKDHSIPCYGLPLQEETVTPTGAAILGALCSGFSTLPPMIVEKIGYGAGSKDFDYPNIIRSFQGRASSTKLELHNSQSLLDESLLFEPVEIIEANIDDLNPEIYDHVMECLFSCGALDVYFTPIQMKKNRPAVKITILASPRISHQLGQILLRETTTLGYRRQSAEKIMLPRKHIPVETPWGTVRVKAAGVYPDYCNIAPEYEDCLSIAREKGIPLKQIYHFVMTRFNK